MPLPYGAVLILAFRQLGNQAVWTWRKWNVGCISASAH